MVVPQATAHRIPRGDELVENQSHEKEPTEVMKLGNATVRVFGPKNLSAAEIDERHLNIHKAIANILRSKGSAQGA